MDYLRWLEAFGRILPMMGGAIVAILNLTGADKHKTIAGDIAKGLVTAGATATIVHEALKNGVPAGEPQSAGP
jgi:hypothetical protein